MIKVRKIAIPNWLVSLSLLLSFGCGVPDLGDPEVLSRAKAEAIGIETLERKLMHGMINLFVDDQGKPYEGWVKEIFPNGKVKSLGLINNGQKQGTWLSWHPNGQLESKVDWHRDKLEGKFEFWHANGVKKTVGQTMDGEMDGEWENYYSSGRLASRVISKVGLAVSAEVWTPDGRKCSRTNLANGEGWYCEYEENKTIKKLSHFAKGVGKELKPDAW